MVVLMRIVEVNTFGAGDVIVEVLVGRVVDLEEAGGVAARNECQ